MRATLESRLRDRLVRSSAPRIAARFEGRLPTLPPLAGLDALARALWLRSWIRRLGLGRRTDPFAAAKALATDLRGLLVTQRQTGLEVRDSIEDDDFLDRQLTLLLSGLANCELMAVLLADALRSLGHSATVWSTGEHELHDGSHTLVHLEAPSGTAFVDAWSDVWALHVPGVRSRGAGPDRAPPGIPHRDSLRVTIQGDGVYPASAYAAGHAKRLPVRPLRPLRALPDWRREPPRTSPTWLAFTELRLRHVLGELPEPPAAYARFIERHTVSEALRVTLRALASPR